MEALSLVVVIPNNASNTAPPLIAIPLTLPMGWAHSPPYFCAFTETITDMANNNHDTPPTLLLLPRTQALHKPQEPTYSPMAITLGSTPQPPLAYTDVYKDDFMLIARHPNHLPTLSTLLHFA